MKRLALVICTSMHLMLYAQESNQTGIMRTDLISPSPTAANLGRYGDIPVTYYTGLPNVSVPIFNVSGHDLNLPVTLTYNFNGFVPAQKAGWVGLGWSLQAGGVITRTVGDKVETDFEGYDRDSASRISPPQSYLQKSYHQAMYDNLPDVFSFNFGNYSGKFLMYKSKAYLMPDQNLQIIPENGGFTIVTENGVRYEFTEPERTSPRINEGGYTPPTYISAWYLTKITDPSNSESIRLSYDSDGTALQFGPKTQTYNEPRTSGGITGYQVQPTNEPGSPNDVFPTRVEMKRLMSIVSDKYSIQFITGAAREDIEMTSGTSYCLGGIYISSTEGLLKRLDFEYEYFGGTAIHHKYLKLKSITDRGITVASKFMKYEFEYHNETDGFGTGILSYVDKFGYYKGGSYMPNNMYIDKDIYQYGTERTPAPSYVKYGALKKITYPTGGSSSFEYEGNRIFKTDNYLVLDEVAAAQASRSDPVTINRIVAVDTVLITAPHQAAVFFSRMDKHTPDPDDAPVEVDHDNEPEVEIVQVYQEEGGIPGRPPREVVGEPFWYGKITLNANNDGQTETVTMEPGKYLIRAVCDEDELMVFAKITYKLFTDTPDPGTAGPGIRLKEIIHDNGFGTTTKKTLKYVHDGGFPSGRLLGSNHYTASNYADVYHSFNLLGATVWTNSYLSHTSSISEAHGIGLPFYYREVSEETTTSTDPGKTHRTDYHFEYFNNTKSVEMTRKTDYLKAAGVFVPQVTEENFFSVEYTGEAFGGMNVFVAARHITYELPHIYEYEFDFEHRLEAVAWKHPTVSRTTTQGEGREQVLETQRFYDVQGHRNITGLRTLLSDGSSIYTRYKYPEDYADLQLSSLINAHMTSSVIEEQIWKKYQNGDSLMISGRINVYESNRVKEVWTLESEIGIIPDGETRSPSGKYTSLISDSRYKKKVDFTYDATGRLLCQRPTNGNPVSYLWGYDPQPLSLSTGKLYPIAEVQNATSGLFYHTSFEDPSGTFTKSVTGKRSHAGQFIIPGTYSGEYRLTYWQKTESGNWSLIEQTLTGPSNYQIGATDLFIDEVRLYPVSATMKTYTYAPGLGMYTANDENNMVTGYEYDFMGRLQAVRDEDGNIVKGYTYHIKDQQIVGGVE